VSYPNLENDLTTALKKILGKEGHAPNIANTYRSKLRSSKHNTARSSSPSDRQTPRSLRIIVTPDDQRARKDPKEEEDVAVLWWNKVKEYIGPTADSVVKTKRWVVF